MKQYGCHSDNTTTAPRGTAVPLIVQDGYAPGPAPGTRVQRTKSVMPVWLDIKCGHIPQQGMGSDPLCAGCVNRGF